MKETLAKADSGRKLLKINPKDVSIQKPADQVDVGSAAKLQIAEYKKKVTYKESKVYTFFKEVTVLYATTASHFIEKSSMKSPIVQRVVCFDPSYIVKNQDKSIRGFGLLSERPLSLKQLPSSKYAEEAMELYKIFVKEVLTSHFEKFEAFDMFQQRVDEFLDSSLSDRKFCYVYDILKIICTLSHAQSSIERGFSINKEHLVENLQEESLIALRIVNDHMLANNLTPSNIQISKAVLENAKASNRCYKNKLQERRDAQNEDKSLVKERSYCSKLMRLLKRKGCCRPLLKKISNALMNYHYRQMQRKTSLFCICQIH